MKKYFSAFLFIISLLFSINVNAETSRKEIGTCQNVYTNYYFLLEANTTPFFNEEVTKSNVGTFENNSYLANFDKSNIGYGQININRSTTTSQDNITSWSLKDYYDRLLKIGNSEVYRDGNNLYISHSKWYDEVYGTNNRIERTGQYDIKSMDVNTLVNASVDATSEIERESEVDYNNKEMILKITRSYRGTGQAVGIESGETAWFLQPQVYYVQYCSDINDTYKIVYDKNTTDEVTNMPVNEEKNILENANISELIPQRNGYRFVSWSTSAVNGNGRNFNPGELYEDKKDLTVYAIWEPNPAPTPAEGTVDNPKTAFRDSFLIPTIGFASLAVGLLYLQYKKGFLKQL